MTCLQQTNQAHYKDYRFMMKLLRRVTLDHKVKDYLII